MAKNSIPDFSATAASNTDIQSVNIDENCPASGINNAIRELMVDLKNVDTGAVALTSPQFATASMTGDLTLGDNAKAVFGASSDLQISHDGSHSIIKDAGTGNLQINAGNLNINNVANSANMIVANDGGAVKLFHNGSNKLETTSSGVDVTGTMTSDGLTVDGGGSRQYINSGHLRLSDNYNLEWGGGTNLIQGSNSSNHILFKTNGGERGRFNANGQLLLGMNSNIGSETINLQMRDSGGTDYGILFSGSATTNSAARFYTGGAVRGSITFTTSGVAYNTSSDYRLKENVTGITNATDRLKQLNPVRFNFIADPDTTVDGFLAHEVSDIVPEAISGEKDAMKDEEYEVTPAVLDDDGNEVTPAEMGTRTVPDYQGIDQSKLVPLLVATIQELEARIAALEA